MPRPTARPPSNTAAGNAARFNQVVAEYAKAPAVTRDRMYIDTMQQIFSSTSKVMIDAKTAATINLPLDQMLSRSVANEAAIGSRSGPVMPAPQAQPGQQAPTNVGTVTVTGSSAAAAAAATASSSSPRSAGAGRPAAAGVGAQDRSAQPRFLARQGDPLMTRLISIAVGAAVVLTLLASSMFVVDQHRYAVVYALGELREVIKEPGLHFKLPPPFQNVVYLDKRLQTLDTSDGERFLTAEKKELVVDAFVKWRIVDPRQYLVAIGGGNADRGAERVAQAVQVALNAEIGARKVADVVSGQREQLAASLRERVAAGSRQLGVEVLDVRLKRVDFTPQVNSRPV
jgi:regulator of protease activity HflC (stomatin/prohibitin superfamily)